MELIYSMRRKPLKCEPPHFERSSDPELVRPICTISCCNIIAFSSPTELADADCNTWGGHVYVCDLDTPWDTHKVVSTTHPVSALEWDGEGKQLIVATSEGEVSVFGQKDFLLNDWTCLYSANFPGEHILKAVFFHNGRRAALLDKKLDAPLAERVQELRPAPTLKGFGGVPVAGACVVTATGLVGALTPAANARALDSLRARRDRVSAADIAHKNGGLLVAAVCVGGGGGGARGAVVRAGLCGLRAPPRAPPLLSLTPLPTLIINTVPTCIAWSLRPDADSLLVAGSTLALWKLTERQHQVHKLLSKGPLQGSTTPGGGQKPASDCFNTLVWQQSGAWGVDGTARSVSAPAPHLPTAPLAALATGSALHLLQRDDHHYICSRTVVPGAAGASPAKKFKYGGAPHAAGSAALCCATLSVNGGVAVAVDARAQLLVYRLPQPWNDIPTSASVSQAASLLEYCMVLSSDPTDVLLTLKPPVAEMLLERLSEWFQRQPPAFQQYHQHAWLRVRTALTRVVPAATASVSWLTALQTLWGLWAALAAALRVDDRPDSAPLAALLDEHHADHDKALIALELKTEFPFESGVLTALRRPLQRAVDIALALIAAGPPDNQHHGYHLWSDPMGVLLLRRLVVLARAAGVGDAALSRQLARLHQTGKPDAAEEWGSPSAREWEARPRAAVSAPHARPLPLTLEYGAVPEGLRCSPPADLAPKQNMDSIRYTYLSPLSGARRCGRCGARALPAPPAPPPARAHHARWQPACRCGGKWALVSSL